MDAIYNIDLGIENCPPSCPKEIFDKTVELLHKEGLLGIKQVNKYGEMKKGYDKNCREFRKAFFNVHYRMNMDFSFPEMLEEYKLKSSSEDNLTQEAIKMGESTLEMIAKTDPTIRILPWNIYTSFPICSSLEIMTPAGRQSLHYHTEDGKDFGVTQLWKPKKGNQFYVLDELKRTLGDLLFEEFEIYRTLRIAKGGFHLLQIAKIKSKLRSLKKSSKIYKQFLLNPDNVKRFPSFIKKLC